MTEYNFRPIAVTLIRKIFVWTTVSALAICLVQGAVAYRLAESHFKLALEEIARTNLPQLSLAIWDIEPEALRRQIQVIEQQHQIGYVRIEAKTGQLFEAGKASLRSSSRALLFEIPHPYAVSGSVGVLEISPDIAALYREVLQSVISVLIGYGMLTLLICAMLAGVLRRELQQPMQRIARFVTELKPETLTRPLELDRPIRRTRDEIDLVVEGFSTLQDGINGHIENLDRVVAERTMQLEAALESIRRMSVTDPLTGVFNRHLFDERFPQEIERAVRYRRPLAIIFCDIDHFKHINDRYGHAVGDSVLRQVSALLAAGLRGDIDWMVRFGGEEFVMVLPETTQDAALVMAERLRAKVFGTPVEVGEGEQIVVTGSFGVAALQTGDRTDSLLKRADAALYAAKAAGRNRVSPQRGG